MSEIETLARSMHKTWDGAFDDDNPLRWDDLIVEEREAWLAVAGYAHRYVEEQLIERTPEQIKIDDEHTRVVAAHNNRLVGEVSELRTKIATLEAERDTLMRVLDKLVRSHEAPF